MKYLLVTEATLTQKYQYLLWGLLETYGIHREECGLMSLLPEGEKPEGSYQKISAAQYAKALPDFRERLEQATAQVLIPLGGSAFRALTGLRWAINSASGYILRVGDCKPIEMRVQVQIGEYKTTKKGKYTKGDPKFAMRKVPQPDVFPKGFEIIVPCIDISTVRKLRFRNVSQFQAAFENAKRVLEGESLVDEEFDKETTWCNYTPPSGLNWQGTIAYDLEAQFGSTDIERASLSGPKGTWTFPWSVDAVRAFKEAMNGATVRVAHNEQFDIPILRAHGIDVPAPRFDTMLAASLLEPDLPKGLDAVVPIYLLASPWKHLSAERGFADPFYSAKDAFMERELAIEQRKRLEKIGMLELFTERMMPAVPVLMDMREKGIKVDTQRALKWCTELEPELQADLKIWNTKYAPDVNPFSFHQLKKLFYITWGLPIQRRKGDGISTDALAITNLKNQSTEHTPALNLLLKLRKTRKLLSTYGKTTLGADYVHPGYLPASKDTKGPGGKGIAGTGRLASSNPNIQNQPPEARLLYIPDREDMCFVELDWSQAELRVAAALSGDKALAEALEGNLHEQTAEMLGCDKRTEKAVLFGSAYLAGPRKIRDTLLEKGIEKTEDECRTFQRGLAMIYPDWWAWRQTVATLAAETQHLRNPFGRYRRFPMGSSDAPAAVDYFPQSIVADMGWTLYREIWEMAQRLDGRLTTVVHDSFLIQVPMTVVEITARKVTEIMEQPFSEVAPGFSIPATVKVGAAGASWGELKEYLE